jgi:7,8-dihydroneopterin aldolase/epimerase/oxygenase
MTGSSDQVVHAFRIADASASVRHMFIRDLVLECLIGVHKHEQRKPQRIRINVDLAVREVGRTRSDKLTDVVDYEEVADRIRAIVASGHVNLVETLAENIADMCLADARIAAVRVRVEKLDIFPDAAAVGVEIERSR